MYGAQTAERKRENACKFENDVEMYGAQTTKKMRDPSIFV